MTWDAEGWGKSVSGGGMSALRSSFHWDIFSDFLKPKVKNVAKMLKAIHAQKSKEAAKKVDSGIEEILS